MAEQLSLLDPPKQKNAKPRVIYFDIETLRSAQDVGGWGNIQKMGVASLVCYDSVDEAFSEYGESRVLDFVQKLQTADLVIGYNILRFDYTVLKGYTSFNFASLPSLDLMDDLTKVLGHRLKLDSLAQATLGQGKTADGLQSLQWVKEGRFDLIREYCQKDVEVTRDLHLYGAREGHVYYQNYAEKVKVPIQWSLDKFIKK